MKSREPSNSLPGHKRRFAVEFGEAQRASIIQLRVAGARQANGYPGSHDSTIIYPERAASTFTDDETPLGYGTILSSTQGRPQRASNLGLNDWNTVGVQQSFVHAQPTPPHLCSSV
jgi:hypothetical protein